MVVILLQMAGRAAYVRVKYAVGVRNYVKRPLLKFMVRVNLIVVHHLKYWHSWLSLQKAMVTEFVLPKHTKGRHVQTQVLCLRVNLLV